MTVDIVPETRRALLVNATGRATVHVFERAEVQPAHPAQPRRLAVAFLFRCTETRLLRRWGLQDLPRWTRWGEDE
jgi:hypothetical protein